MIDNLPRELRECGLFCLWRYEKDKKGRPTKVPYNPNKPSQKGDSTNKEMFSTLEKVNAIGGFDGIGVGIFNPVCGIDIDHCVEGGRLSAKAQQIVNTMKCYTEYSPSGEGLHLYFSVSPDFKYDDETFYIKHGDLEVYVAGCTNRFLTVTGNVYRPGELEERTFEMLEVIGKYMRRPTRSGDSKEEPPIKKVDLSDDEIIRKAAAAKNGDKFMKLWSGDTSGYSSDSEADLALCNILAFWAGNNPDRMDELFRQSGLYRDKWDGKRGGSTYGQQTIAKAIRYNSTVYNPEIKSLAPADYTDVGQARVLVAVYGERLRYSRATGFLVYTGKRWEDAPLKAQALSQELTELQLKEARRLLSKARTALDAAIEKDSPDQAALKAEVSKAEDFRKYVLGRRSSSKVAATLTEAAPTVQIEVEELDSNGYLLNTPAGTVDLRSGQIRLHKAEDYCTRITTVSPDDAGSDMWRDFLGQLTCGDQDLQRYLQDIAGLCSIGHVKREELVIATGSGGNGKSTFFNLLSRVLGDYAGMLSAEVFTVGYRGNKSPEYAELRGKRLVIAAELQEGARLDTSTVKKLCSTDQIVAEKKYRDPFKFTPSHHVILYTNHLPRVGTNDNGTWSRLVVVPFNAKFRGERTEVKDYASHLFDGCGGAVLSWMIAGAVRVISQDFIIQQPLCVQGALARYRNENDWLHEFINECCEVDDKAKAAAGELQNRYRTYCQESGGYIRHNSEFARALEDAGFESRKMMNGRFYFGLRVKKTG